jgi:hypothetical protein
MLIFPTQISQTTHQDHWVLVARWQLHSNSAYAGISKV